MKTAVAAADFEAHEELRLLLWALLRKRIERLATTYALLAEFSRLDLKKISDFVIESYQALDDLESHHAGDPDP